MNLVNPSDQPAAVWPEPWTPPLSRGESNGRHPRPSPTPEPYFHTCQGEDRLQEPPRFLEGLNQIVYLGAFKTVMASQCFSDLAMATTAINCSVHLISSPPPKSHSIRSPQLFLCREAGVQPRSCRPSLRVRLLTASCQAAQNQGLGSLLCKMGITPVSGGAGRTESYNVCPAPALGRASNNSHQPVVQHGECQPCARN